MARIEKKNGAVLFRSLLRRLFRKEENLWGVEISRDFNEDCSKKLC